MSKLSTNEVGCQINLATGKHFGECRGACPESDERHKLVAAGFSSDFSSVFSDTAHGDGPLARIEALEAQVRELQGHRHPSDAGVTGQPFRALEDG